ncbi:radical SAM protein [Verrucomicrobiota bacterium]
MPENKDKRKSEVSLTEKLRQRSLVDYLKQINWGKGSSNPWVVEFDPTTICNLACPDCISRDLLNKGFFSRKRVRELVKEMVDAGVKAVVLIGGGEPLAHPEIGWVIEYLGQNDVHVGITTNGLLIGRYIDCIAKYANWVRVSVDAATSDTFNRIRTSPSGVSVFNKVIENMKKLAKIKSGKLGYSFMIYSEGEFDKSDSCKKNRKEEPGLIPSGIDETGFVKPDNDRPFSNVSEIYQAALLAKEIGCDYYEVKPMYNIHHFAISQREDLISMVKEQIEQALLLEDDNFRVLQATKLKNTLSGESSVEQKDYTRCAVAQLRTLVTSNGTYICPYFRGRDDKELGNVKEMSFQDMWHGEQRRKVMDKLDPSLDCKMHCIRHDSNLILEDMIKGKEAEVVDDFDRFI